MNALPGPAYHFRTPDQWARAHGAAVTETLSVDPDSGSDGGAIAGCPVRRLALSARGDLFLVDARGVLLAAGGEAPFVGVEGPSLGPVERLVAGDRRLWALTRGAGEEDGQRRLIQIDAATLHVLIDAEADGVIDIAPDGRDGLWLLAGRTLRRMTDGGAEIGEVRAAVASASAVAAAGERLALLTEDGRRLVLPDAGSGPAMTLDLSRLAGPGWIADRAVLSSAGSAFLLEGEVERCAAGGETVGEPRFFLIGPGGDLLAGGRWRDDRAPVLLAASGTDLLGLFGPGGAQRLRRFEGLAQAGGQRRLTPALETISPEGRWLRAEVKAQLPERATLSLRWAASADAGLRAAVDRVLADPTRPMARRLERAEALLEGQWSESVTYVGAHNEGPASLERFAFPLHEANGPLLWVDVQLRRNSAGAAPRIEALLVLHEAESLMDDLPAIYSGGGDRDGTMRRLVAVLEATTQGIDHEIGSLARRLDPRRASARWLPELAAMLGLPFHDALSPEMQRNLVKAAAPILARRGTGRGLAALLEALFPGRPVRVADRTEQLVPIALGRGAAGRSLPALLSGPSIRAPKLNARLVLNATALYRTNACAEASIAPPPQVLVTIPATPSERRRYGHAVAAMAEAMIPAGVRLRVNWTPWRRGQNPVADDVLATIDTPGLLGLGAGPGLGRARLGGRAAARLDGHGVTPAAHRLL